MKETPPQLDASDMPDITKMTPAQLAIIPYDKWRLFCCIKGCNRFIHVRDYGVLPRVAAWSGRRWININIQVYFCGLHNRMYKNAEWDKLPFKTRYKDETRKTFMEEPK